MNTRPDTIKTNAASRRHPLRTYCYLTGQYDNLGDAILRRGLVDSFDVDGGWHVYIGSATESYIRALHLPSNAVRYRSLTRWLWKATLDMARRGHARFITNPGEISSTRVELALGLMSAWIVGVGKVAGNRSYRLGIGARDKRRPLSIGHELAARGARMNVWRDSESRDLFGTGEVAPDWAFALEGHQSTGDRDIVVLAYRHDKPLPSREVLHAVRDWCQTKGYRLIVVSQVERDVVGNQSLADTLHVEHVYSQQRSLEDVEATVRRVYKSTVVILGNRIHSLILGAIDGAAPAVVLGHKDVKVGRTLRAAGLYDGEGNVTGNAADIAEYLETVAQRGPATRAAVRLARERLHHLARKIQSDLA